MDLFTFLLAVMLLELTPGPNMAYLATLAVSRGRAAGLIATAGVAFGLAIFWSCGMTGSVGASPRSIRSSATKRNEAFLRRPCIGSAVGRMSSNRHANLAVRSALND
jgi:hypothetical protein